MALPSGSGYATADIQAPPSDLTEFSLVVDLSNLPQSWWDAVDTSDPTKGRVAKDGDGTELAADWIEFDQGNQTGKVRVLWSGTLSSAGGDTLRVYPPQSGNASYAASDTYGQYNAYDQNWQLYMPDGGTQDRTARAATGTAENGASPGNATGPVGAATDFGANEYINFGDDVVDDISPPGAVTMMQWCNPDAGRTTDDQIPFEIDGGWWFPLVRTSTGSGEYAATTEASTSNTVDGTTDVAELGLVHLAFWSDGSQLTGYVDAAQEMQGPQSISDISGQSHRTAIASGYYNDARLDPFDGVVGECQLHDAKRGADWIQQEYDQFNDNAAFYGTWTWTTDSTGPVAVTGTGQATAIGDGKLNVTGQKFLVGTGNGQALGSGVLLTAGDVTAGEAVTDFGFGLIG